MATRSSPVSEARGGAREELPRPRPGAVSGTSSPISKGVAALPPEGQRSDSTFKAGRGGGAQIRVVQVRSSGCALLEEP